MAREKKSLNASVSQAIKGTFDLDKFKQSKYLDQPVKFKPQRWIPLSKTHCQYLVFRWAT